jgi:hypothetical protein
VRGLRHNEYAVSSRGALESVSVCGRTGCQPRVRMSGRGEEKRTRTYLAIGAGVPIILPCALMTATRSRGRALALRRAGGLSAAAQREDDAHNDLQAGRVSYAHFSHAARRQTAARARAQARSVGRRPFR